MVRRVLRALTSLARSMRDIAFSGARFLRDVVLASACARVCMMIASLWPKVPPLAVTLASILALVLWGAFSTGQSIFLLLAPVSPTGIGAGLAAIVVALVLAELCSVAMLSLLAALLQLAADTGRHRVHALIVIAAALALLASLPALREPEQLADMSMLVALLAAIGIVLLAAWFGRTYRRAGHRRFRDFHVDVTEARLHLAGPPHGR